MSKELKYSKRRYKHATPPADVVRGFEELENECVVTLLTGIPEEGGFATKAIFERLIRMAFQGGLVAATRDKTKGS